ncbi:MAG: TolC family protein [Polyangiaceae bacterium]|nr:TolC family protein [Polyangiaceae bacterium]
MRNHPILTALLSSLSAAAFAGVAVAQPAPPAPATPPAPAAPPAADAPAMPKLSDQIARVSGAAGGLTAAEVGRRATATSFDVRARWAEVEAAAARVDEAHARYVPVLTLTARYTRLSPVEGGALGGGGTVVAPFAPPGQPIDPATTLLVVAPPFAFESFENQYALTAQLVVPLSDYFLRIGDGAAATKASERAARTQHRATQLQAASDARSAYWQWVRAKLQLLVVEQARELARSALTDAKRLQEAELATKADVLRAESQVAGAELLVERTRGLVRVLDEQLRTAMHQDDAAPLTVGEDLLSPPPEVAGVDALEPLVAEARRQRLELRALDETVQALGRQRSVTRAGLYPRLDAIAEGTYANPNQRIFPQRDEFDGTWSLTAQATWVVTDLPGASAGSRAIEAQIAALEAQARQAEDGIRLQVTQAWLALREAKLAVVTSERGLAAAEESYRVRRELFAAGRARALELTDAETELTRARLEVVNARVDVRLARERLLHAIGRDARDAAAAKSGAKPRVHRARGKATRRAAKR